MKKLGIYIHIPFCLSKCRYCDFCSFPHPHEDNVKKYINALFREIDEYKSSYSEYNVNTIYFGGGTPTLLNADTLVSLLKAIKQNFSVSDSAEISVECNPATADAEYFKKLRSGGFNRLSIGIQSMNDNELKLLGRLHNSIDAENTFRNARYAGFDNISVDIMYGIPDQTCDSLKQTLNRICDLSPEHISLYGLKIEDGTYFSKHRNELELPTEDDEFDMYMSSTAFLASKKYQKYEISNFAKDGKFSRHNLKYWQREDYVGIGLSSHSCVGNKRFSNTYDIKKYLHGNRHDTEELISAHDVLCEKIMLGMRLSKGIDFDFFGKNAEPYRNSLERFTEGGHIKKDGNTLSFTDTGMYVSNYILSEILDFEN